MSNTKQPRNAKAEYWQAQTADARCSRDRANAKNDLLRAQCADMAEALRCAVDALSRLGYQDMSEHDGRNFAAMRAALAKAGL